MLRDRLAHYRHCSHPGCIARIARWEEIKTEYAQKLNAMITKRGNQLTDLTEAGKKVILRALKRGEPFYVCPTPGLNNAVQSAVLDRLARTGYIREPIGSPTLTEKGVDAARKLWIQLGAGK